MSYEYFNHPAVATSKSQPKPDGRVYGPGVRVPMYVISPWSRGGWVNSQVFDHTSILQFLENVLVYKNLTLAHTAVLYVVI